MGNALNYINSTEWNILKRIQNLVNLQAKKLDVNASYTQVKAVKLVAVPIYFTRLANLKISLKLIYKLAVLFRTNPAQITYATLFSVSIILQKLLRIQHLFMLDSKANDVAYLEKRLKLAQQENDLLRKENQLQRKELTQMKSTFTNIIQTKRVKTADGRNNSLAERFSNEDALRQVLEMQRQRINALERENEQMKQKYEKVLFQDKSLPYSQIQVNEQIVKELHDLRIKNAELQNQIKEMVSSHAKELANYRTKIAQSDAQIFMSQSQRAPQLSASSRHSQDLEPVEKYQILRTGIKKY